MLALNRPAHLRRRPFDLVAREVVDGRRVVGLRLQVVDTCEAFRIANGHLYQLHLDFAHASKLTSRIRAYLLVLRTWQMPAHTR